MNYGKVEGRSSSRSRSPSTARRAATSAILTDILSRSDRAPTSRTVDARPRKSILIVSGDVSGPVECGPQKRELVAQIGRKQIEVPVARTPPGRLQAPVGTADL